jgi:hypothetical protein
MTGIQFSAGAGYFSLLHSVRKFPVAHPASWWLFRWGVQPPWLEAHTAQFGLVSKYPSIIRMIKSRRMRWAGYVVRIGEKRNAYRILVGNPEGKRPLGRPDVGGWTILKWILER